MVREVTPRPRARARPGGLTDGPEHRLVPADRRAASPGTRSSTASTSASACCTSSRGASEERRLHINAIGPVWDGNEVWLLTGGGALFAAFPAVYATVFSGFYLALMLRRWSRSSCGPSPSSSAARSRRRRGGAVWDWAFGLGSLVPALLYGVAVGNILRGLPFDARGNLAVTFLGLLNPYALLVGAPEPRDVRCARRHVPHPQDRGPAAPDGAWSGPSGSGSPGSCSSAWRRSPRSGRRRTSSTTAGPRRSPGASAPSSSWRRSATRSR